MSHLFYLNTWEYILGWAEYMHSKYEATESGVVKKNWLSIACRQAEVKNKKKKLKIALS